jgi:simple sugar transport system ATP-binding protein
VVAECDPRRETTAKLAELMVGTEIAAPSGRHEPSADAPTRLAVKRLSLRSDRQFGTDLQDIGFSVRSGEILGIAGVAGNGQGELMEALSGEILAKRPDAITIDGAPVGRLNPRRRRVLGGCFVPEERNGHGAVGAMSLTENGFLSGYVRRALVRLGLIDGGRATDFAAEVIHRFDVRTTGPAAEARALSGGNLQKFVVGREVLQDPKVLVVSQPTWGVDAGAAAAIHRAILDLAARGAAVVVISQDLDEIFSLCDTIAVMAGGRLSPKKPIKDVTTAEIGVLMGGVHEATAGASGGMEAA